MYYNSLSVILPVECAKYSKYGKIGSIVQVEMERIRQTEVMGNGYTGKPVWRER